MKNITKLTQKLVSIPSWVGETNNENAVNNFIFGYLKKYSNLKVEKQLLKGGRFNVLASPSKKVDCLVIGHTDTVPISNKWTVDPFKGTIKDGRLYGRGTTDMKGGVAAMLLAATRKDLPKNTAFLFYVDEEYNFAGMKEFIACYKNKMAPKTIISLDGSELEVANGCRGLIEIELIIGGISAHAATPQNGRNALLIAYQVYQGLEEFVSQFKDPELGNSIINLGMISGGIAPNVVPDSCSLTLDIRPASSKLNAKKVEAEIKRLVKLNLGTIQEIKTNFDFPFWLTPKSKIRTSLPFKNLSKSGYIDIALLFQAFNRPTCLTFGAGTQSMAHKADEYIEIAKLEKSGALLFDLIQSL